MSLWEKGNKLEYLIALAFILMGVIPLASRVLISKKHPPYVQENKGYYNSISVFVWSSPMRRFPWSYHEYTFVKRDNGKYRMEYKFLDWFYIVFPTLLCSYAMFLLFIFREYFVKDPGSIPALITFVLWLLSNIVLANYPKIEARLCLKKHLGNL